MICRSAFFSVVPNAGQMLDDAGCLGPKTAENGTESYRCEKCDYATSKVGNWEMHLETKKHNAGQMLDDAGCLGTKTDEGASPQDQRSASLDAPDVIECLFFSCPKW